MRRFLTRSQPAAIAVSFAVTFPCLAATNEGSGSLLAYGGALLGASFVSPNATISPELGLDVGVQIRPRIGLGGFFGFTPQGTANSVGTSSVYTFAAEANYFADSLWVGSRIGVKAGLSYTQFVGDLPPDSSHSVNLVLGPLVGYDYAIGNGYSVGAEASLLLTSTTPLRESLAALFVARYWF